MSFGSPVAVMLLFSLLALCAVLFALPILRSPPPGFESKKCPGCGTLNRYNADTCKKCGLPLKETQGTPSPTPENESTHEDESTGHPNGGSTHTPENESRTKGPS